MYTACSDGGDWERVTGGGVDEVLKENNYVT